MCATPCSRLEDTTLSQQVKSTIWPLQSSRVRQRRPGILKYKPWSRGQTLRLTIVQAIRTLNLLEQHHKKLGQILKFRHENPSKPLPPDAVLRPSSPTTLKHPSARNISPPEAARTSSPDSTQTPPRLPNTSRRSGRDITTSIASNLASARGIPGPQPNRRGATVSPTVSAHQAGGKFAANNEEKTGRSSRDRLENVGKHTMPFFTSTESPTQLPKPLINTTGNTAATEHEQHKSESTATEQTFQQFYSTFENVLSKISAPLAFTGLPLTGPKPVQSQAPTEPNTNKKGKARVSPSSSQASEASIHTTAGDDDAPDYSKFISRAALRAVRENNPTLGENPAESFYVVPTTGGTVSYAGILSRAEQDAMRRPSGRHSRQLSNISEDTNDDFQDAREMPIPSANTSPEVGRDRRGRKTAKREESALKGKMSNKTIEELEMENDALKRVTDLLSKRVHMWEVNAQSSSAALQQSLRSLHQQPPRSGSPLTVNVGPGSETGEMDDATAKTISQLEERIRKVESEKERQKRENEKLKTVVDKYRDRWEKLKEGARVRREGQGTPRTKAIEDE